MTTQAKQKRTNDLQLNSWNVRTLSGPGALTALVSELKYYRCNITAIQETRWEGRCEFSCEGFTVLSSGGRRGAFGTGFLVDAKWTRSIIGWTPVNEKLCVLRVRGKFFTYSIINVHAPHNEKSEDEKENFYNQLARTYNKCPKHDIKIVIGDLNAQVGREEIFKPTIGKFSFHNDTNENGLKLINFAAAHNMVISSTCFRHKKIHLTTWTSPGLRIKSQIDHVLIDGRHASDVLDVRSYRCLEPGIEHHDSDHFLLGVRLRARLSSILTTRAKKCRRIDIAKLQVPGMRRKFRLKLEERLDGMNDESVSWDRCRDAMTETAEETLGYQTPGKKNSWYDDECKQAVQAVIEARAKGRMTRERESNIRKLQREKKKVLRKKKREFESQQISEIENLHDQNETRKFYRAINFAKKGFQPRTKMCRKKDGDLVCDMNGVLERWREHFDDLLNAEDDFCERTAPRKKSYETNDGKGFPLPSIEEVAAAIKKLKNNKAPGDDGLPGELFKAGGECLRELIHKLIVSIWSEERLPKEFKTSVICPLFKKGCKLECKNYRGISLLPTAYKILSNILAARLEPLAEDFLQSYQAGFRRGLSTTDQIFCLRLITQKSYEMNTEVLNLFIDFKAAYDTIIREELWGIMVQFGFPNKLIRLLKATLQGVMCSVKIQGSLSRPFESTKGLRQGDALSTILFNIALEGVVRRSGVETSGSIFNKSTQLLGYADDIDILARNIRSLSDSYLRLEKEANNIGLKVNEDKTQLLMICPSDRTKNLVGDDFVVGDKKFKVVTEFTYLGTLADDKFNTNLEIKRRIIAAQRAFYGVRHLLSSRRISRKAKFTIYKTLIRPVAIYGAESWNTTADDEERLAVFERMILRVIIGPVKVEEEVYRKRYNHELYQIFREPDIVLFSKHRRLSWAGHVARREENHPVAKVFKGTFRDGKRSRGRRKISWEEGVRKDSAEFGMKNWQKDAQNRSKYRQTLDAVMARTRAEQPVK